MYLMYSGPTHVLVFVKILAGAQLCGRRVILMTKKKYTSVTDKC